MKRIFVFIKCELGRTYEVAAQIVDEIAETGELHSVSGEHDLLARFDLDGDVDIGRFVCEKLQPIPGIADTFTLVAFNAFS